MSAYVCSDETLNRLALDIKRYIYQIGLTTMQSYYPLLVCDRAELVQKLHAMNVNAVCQRYEKDAATMYLPPSLKTVMPSANSVAMYKLLRGYLHQCSEDDVPDSDLYQQVEKMSQYLAAEIISKLPEYQTAAWTD